MAKKPPKETSTPVVVALVFFVLTTIAFGVMWYMQYADQETKNEEVAKAKKDVSSATALAKEADLNAKLYRVYLGVDDPDDKTSMLGDHKPGDKLSAELKRINDSVAKKLGLADATALPAELRTWSVDASGQIDRDGPTQGIIETVSKANADRDAAIANETKATALYVNAATAMNKASQALSDAKKDFEEVAKSLPKKYEADLQAAIGKFDNRVKSFVAAEAQSRKEYDTKSEEVGRLDREKKKQEFQLTGLQEQIALLISQAAKNQNNTFQYDAPQGKVLRRILSEGVIEINLGSADLVRPGLTFTVLPYNYPEKGRQSRVRVMRIPDERGEYKNVERFVEKATVEVIEVVGPHLSRARITQEFDPIRDGAAPGDLIYNSVWRKGAADHIALVGIFDVNGDGGDDIQTVVRDLNRMGVPVDAYFDLRERKWVGKINEQTRYVVEGWYPSNSAQDPNREDKTALLSAITDAVKEARDKGVTAVKFQDFFPRMGYRAKLDLPLDKLNQATAPYLNRVNIGEMPPNPN